VLRAALTLAIALGLLGGCRSSPAAHAHRLPPPPAPPVSPVSSPITQGSANDVVRAAVEVLRAEGLTLASCDSSRVVSSRFERDVPCDGVSCLARESITVRVGYRQARVEVVRELWNPAMRSWDPELGSVAVADGVRRGQALLDRILGAAARRGSDRWREGACDADEPALATGLGSR
jgi:hypothetical protein